MLSAISRSRLLYLLPLGAFSDGPKIDEVSHERSALTLFNFNPPISRLVEACATVTPIMLARSDGNHRFYDLRRSRRWPPAGRTLQGLRRGR